MRVPSMYRALVLLLTITACAPGGLGVPEPFDCPATELPRLVRVADVAPGLLEDIRYATANNFTGAPLPGYEIPGALLRPDAAAALARVQRRLEGRGYGLLVWDAYRPVRATLAMVDWAERSGNEWVLNGWVSRRSNHNRGNTVDLTVVRLDSEEPLDMGTPFDHFGDESRTSNATGQVAANRRILLDAMRAEGFSNYPQEWWHYTHTTEAEPVDVPIGCYLR
ncbi:MAG TPA: M15 family metallopeptidase [Longimicrobiales bacterium]|nr:M15 family metallopeptidase [Longimicrobiales bacterium]